MFFIFKFYPYDEKLEYSSWKLIEKRTVTHDCQLFVLKPPDGACINVPIGYHVYLYPPGHPPGEYHNLISLELNMY